MGLAKRLIDWERGLRAYYNVDLSTPENRRRARIYNLYFDHAILRGVWTNFYEVAPGVYRSNNPTHKRFKAMRDMGIKSILNLRGESNSAFFLAEQESCRELGLNLVSTPIYSRLAASREEILALIDIFRRIERPFLMHCKSGADRAGMASAIYLLAIENRPVEEARKMLSPRFLHFRNRKVGILDYILDCYEARLKKGEIRFEDWIATEYDGRDMQARFAAGQPPE